MVCTQCPPWISDRDISVQSPVFPSILLINSFTGFIRGILRGVRYAKSLRVLFLHRRSPSWTTLVLYSRAVFIFNEPTTWVELCAPLPISFQNANLWTSRRWEGSHRTGCGRNSLKISTPLPLKRTFWITKLLSKSILIDSTFKDEVTPERLVVRRTLYTLLRALYTWGLVLYNFVVRQKIRH
jgi:hypothetical protein